MKKLLLVLLSAFIFTNTFAAVTRHGFSRPLSLQEALNQKLAAGSEYAVTVINFDITKSLIAYYSVNSGCDTPFDGNGQEPGQILYRSASGAKLDNPLPSTDPVCLYDAVSHQEFFNQAVPVPSMVTAYADSGTWQVNITPIN